MTGTSTGTVLKLKTVSFVDQQGIGTEAFNLLIPSDWQYDGSINWVMDNPAMPVTSQFHVWNPDGTEQVQVFPNQAFFWTDSSLTASLFPPGSEYFGNVVREPLKSVEALKEIVIPRFYSDVKNLTIIKEQNISNLVNSISTATQTQSTISTSTDAGRIRIEYTENGKTMEDEIYCVVEATYIPLQTMDGMKTNTMWGVNYIYSFSAEKGKLDVNANIFKTISKSVTVNFQWFNRYVKVIQYLIKANTNQINRSLQLDSILAQTDNAILPENQNMYSQIEAANDYISNQFIPYFGEVESYYDPLKRKEVELPSGYNTAWTNSEGAYILTDKTTYNPDTGDNNNWQILEKIKTD
jgi:hypothetical protein